MSKVINLNISYKAEEFLAKLSDDQVLKKGLCSMDSASVYKQAFEGK